MEAVKPYVLRRFKTGDEEWVIRKHGELYAAEYGWNHEFEELVSNIMSAFITSFDKKREQSWIAELNGEIVGSIFVASESETVAKVRLLLVDPKARGLGLGSHLVDECISFARNAGYKKLVLWTNSVLIEARHIYKKKGFILAAEEKHHSFGKDLVGETWEYYFGNSSVKHGC
ncbi:GNAT family N-acetyltransferase [Peribacillus deserti]|uniref:GNAT family N-acetyltransferase n=1 Tax=Peribacillus deserti TaxID=673318 RepID=UPI00215346B5|nr:GNAT family N-acetyltransferase [Peribacillus deserti]